MLALDVTLAMGSTSVRTDSCAAGSSATTTTGTSIHGQTHSGVPTARSRVVTSSAYSHDPGRRRPAFELAARPSGCMSPDRQPKLGG
jgi:hypothetical protein